MSVTCNRCEETLDSKLELVIHFWLVHGVTLEEAESLTDSSFYGGTDSGCEQASKYLGYPSRCRSCPFRRCILDMGRQRNRQRNAEIRKLYKRGMAITDIAVVYQVTPRTVQRVVKGVKV